MWWLDELCVSPVPAFLGRLLGWLWGAAAAAGAYALQVLLLLPILAEGGLQLSCGVAVVLALVRLVCWLLTGAWHRALCWCRAVGGHWLAALRAYSP